MEQFTQPVERLSSGQETAAKHGSLQLLSCAGRQQDRSGTVPPVARRRKTASCSEGSSLAMASWNRPHHPSGCAQIFPFRDLVIEAPFNPSIRYGRGLLQHSVRFR